jgi:putative PIN family toxin of toxin-antitoxin system
VSEPGVTADTNIYISALEFGGLPLDVLTAARQRRIRLAISPPLREELSRVLREKFGWSDDRLQALTVRLSRFTTLVQPTRTIDAVPEDPDDNRVLECAVAAGSDYIVTGDAALLRLAEFEGIRIVRVADFMALIDP